MYGEGEPKKRLKSLDVFKGIAIFCIVLGHLIILEENVSGSTESFSGIIRTIIEFLYMGLIVFFVVSGYFYNPYEGLSKKVIGRVLKFIIAIMLGIIVLTTLLYGYLCVCGYSMDIAELPNSIIFQLTGNGCWLQPYSNITALEPSECSVNAGYYFLFVMVTATILYYLIARYAMKDMTCSVVIIIALLTISMLCVEVIQVRLPFYLELTPIATAAMICGSLCHKYRVVERLEDDPFNRKVILGAVASLILGLLLCWSPLSADLGFHSSHFGIYGGFSAYTILPIALVCGFFMIYLCVLLSKVKYLSTVFSKLGAYSLGILLMSTFFCKIVIAPFLTIPHDNCYPYLTMAQVILVAVIATILCVATTYAVNRLLSGSAAKKKDEANVQ